MKKHPGIFGIKSQEHCGKSDLVFGHDLDYHPELTACERDESRGGEDLCRAKDGSLHLVIEHENFNEAIDAMIVGGVE